MSQYKLDWTKVNFCILLLIIIVQIVFGVLIIKGAKDITTKPEMVEKYIYVVKNDTIEIATGQASYYAERYEGKLTANGETFSVDSLTAASNHLPFGTRLLVTNMYNGKTVIVKVNDRGPFRCTVNEDGSFSAPFTVHPTRIIDLSKAAMLQLDGINDGVIPIQYKII